MSACNSAGRGPNTTVRIYNKGTEAVGRLNLRVPAPLPAGLWRSVPAGWTVELLLTIELAGWSRPGATRVVEFAPCRGRSGLRRAGCWLTASRGDPQESATENKPPMDDGLWAGVTGKGETVRQERTSTGGDLGG